MDELKAQVSAVFWCEAAGQAMRSARQVRVIAGAGLEGDRYCTGRGAYSDTQPPKIRHISFITQDGIDIANEWQEAAGLPGFSMAQTRRNVLLQGLSAQALNALVGQRFWVGAIECYGIELATPCPRPSALSGLAGFQDAFEGRGGLRAQVLSTGWLQVGDALGMTTGDNAAPAA